MTYPLNLDTLAKLYRLGYRYLVIDREGHIVHARTNRTAKESLEFLGMIEVEIDIIKEINPEIFGTISLVRVP